jgi:PTS system nitrogen regulatory IIA component
MGGGVAIPHARLQDLKKPFGIFVRLRREMDFGAIDSRPVDLVFLLLLPAAEGDQLNALASVARKLRTPEDLVRMRNARSQAELYAAIAG